MAEKTVAILGGGASGTLVALRLLAAPAAGPLRILWVERRSEVGAGIAYGTPSPRHLLNVAAGRMSAFEERPESFLEFARRSDPGTAAGDFLPRARYADYLRTLLAEAVAAAPPNVRLERLEGEVRSLEPSPRGGGGRFELTDGRRFEAQRVVLALGNLPPSALPQVADETSRSGRVIADPWAPAALDAIRPEARVLIVGTGLTMVDVVAELEARGVVGPVWALSRRGLVPQGHALAPVAPVPLPEPARASLRGWLRAVRRAVQAGAEWRAVVDALRPHTAALWRGLAQDEKRRFLRHLRPFWDVHRHRLAPTMAGRLEGWLESGQLTVVAGRLVQSLEDGDALDVRVRLRHTRNQLTLRVDHLINCSGPAGLLAGAGEPLLAELLASGLLRADELGLGAERAPEGTVIDAFGRASSWLYGIGPLFRGRDWEATAIPELRRDAAWVAERVRASLATSTTRARPIGAVRAQAGTRFVAA